MKTNSSSESIICKNHCTLIGLPDKQPDWYSETRHHPQLQLKIHKSINCYPSDIIKPDNIIPYGLYNQKQNALQEFVHFRGHNNNRFKYCENNLKDQQPLNTLYGKSLYLGWIFPHYGHFITESLSRLWCIDLIDLSTYDHFLYHYRSDKKDFPNQNQYVWELFSRLGIDRQKIVFIDKPYCVEELHIPNQGIILRGSITTAMNKVWKTIANIYEKPFRKVYLSRTGINRRVLVNENKLEQELIKKGFEIINPQELSISQQLTLYAQTKILISPSGSALHNAVFMHESCRVICITANDFMWINEMLCCYASGIDYSIYQGTSRNENNEWTLDVDAFLSYL